MRLRSLDPSLVPPIEASPQLIYSHYGQPNGGVWRPSPNETNSQRQQSGSKSSTHVQATLRLCRAGKHSGKSRRFPPVGASPSRSASAREVSRDTANPALKMKRLWPPPAEVTRRMST